MTLYLYNDIFVIKCALNIMLYILLKWKYHQLIYCDILVQQIYISSRMSRMFRSFLGPGIDFNF